MAIDFGKTADDYATHRAGFPDSFFDRLLTDGLVIDGKLHHDPEDELVTGPRVSGAIDAPAVEEEQPAADEESEPETGEPTDG